MSFLARRIRNTLLVSARLAAAAAALLALVAAPSAGAQTPAPQNVPFEFASIKRNLLAEEERTRLPPNATVVPGRAQTLRGGYLRGRAMTVRELIRDAYGHRNREQSAIVGAPDWIANERYDVDASGSA